MKIHQNLTTKHKVSLRRLNLLFLLLHSDLVLEFWRGLFLSEMPSFCFKGSGMPRFRSDSRSLESPVILPSNATMNSAARCERHAKALWFYDYAAVVLFGGISLVSQRTKCCCFVHAHFYCIYLCKSGSLVHLYCFSDGG